MCLMDDQEKMNQPTTSDASFENYYLQENSFEDEYMSPGAKLIKAVSNCQKEEEEIEEGEVISEKYDNPKCFSPEINQYSPASIIDFDMGSRPPPADTINRGDWKVKGKRSRRYITEIRPKNHLQSRKLDKETEAAAAQKEEKKFRLKKKRKFEEFAVEEKGDDFNGGKTAVAEDNHIEMPMKKKLMLKINGLNQRADKSAGIVSLAADQKMDDQDNLKTYSTSSEADIIKRDADVNHKAVTPKEYKCNICGGSFPSGQALGGHKSSGHSVKVKLEGPDSKFNNLKVQNALIKKQRENVGGQQEIHGCNICDKSYNSRKALSMHKRKHIEDNGGGGGGGGGSKDQNFISPKRVLDFDLNEPCPEQEID